MMYLATTSDHVMQHTISVEEDQFSILKILVFKSEVIDIDS